MLKLLVLKLFVFQLVVLEWFVFEWFMRVVCLRVVCARYNQEMTGTAPKTMSNGRTPVFNLFHFSRTGDFVDHCGYHCVVPVWFVAFVPTTGQEE